MRQRDWKHQANQTGFQHHAEELRNHSVEVEEKPWRTAIVEAELKAQVPVEAPAEGAEERRRGLSRLEAAVGPSEEVHQRDFLREELRMTVEELHTTEVGVRNQAAAAAELRKMAAAVAFDSARVFDS